MVNGRCESNIANVSGVIVNKPVFGHEIYGEGFYYFDVKVKRLSNSFDVIPVTVSERLADFSEYETDEILIDMNKHDTIVFELI